MTVQIIKGDCRDVLQTLPDESVHCVVTSPPYWGLRDYGVTGQLGMESSLAEHVESMVDVFLEVRRVLKSDGTLWLNYGDSYAASSNGRSAADIKTLGNDDRTFRDKPFSTIGPINRGKRNGSRWGGGNNSDATLKPKDLCGIPWRVAFGLQESGWWLRQDIIWSKPNPMPESVTDRCTKAHEYLFLLSKNERYHFNQDAIAEPATYSGLTGQDESGFKNATNFNGKNKDGGVRGEKPDKQRGHSRRHAGFNDRWDKMEKAERCSGMRNKRSVWTISTEGYREAHFATFPPALVEPCILAGCPVGGTVLDPFGGAGTTGMVADRLKRNAILIELNTEYADMAERRISRDAGMFAEVCVV
jgi:DNA modification methylase